MVELQVRDGMIDVEVRGLHKLWALRSRIRVPASAVTSVGRPSPLALRNVWKGWRAPGTHLPGVLVAGTFYKRGQRHFWDVRHRERAIQIDLEGAGYDRLFVEVDDPAEAIARVERARSNA